jgi:hypothetical protein
MNGRVSVGATIVDYGSGGGRFVAGLRRQGFRHSVGVDPYALEGPLVRRTLPAGRIALFTLNHSLEHVADQRALLETLRLHQSSGDHLFVRTPLADSYAAEHFGADWVQLDPPRHLLVHSSRSIERLAEDLGYELVSSWRDSGALQFWGSEMYRKGVHLMDPRSPDLEGGLFSPEELSEFRKRAEELNQAGVGDQGAFVFRLAGM